MISPLEIYKRRRTLATHSIHTMPVLVLMPHSRCDCRCLMCDIWKANQNRVELSRKEITRQLPDLRQLGTRWVVLSGGEALMHSNLWALCELLEELGARITLLSTGLLLAQQAANVVRWCDEVIVSLDGSRQVHDAIRRVPRAYDRLTAGVAALRGEDSEYRITGRCVVQRRNYFDIQRIIDAAHEIGLDQISFLGADVATEAFNRPIPWDEKRVTEVALSATEAEEFAQLIEETLVAYKAEFRSGFVAEGPAKLRRLGRYFRALHSLDEFPETICNAPWVSAVIEANGDVRPCFFHPPYGSIREKPLAEILNAKAAVSFRRRLDVTCNPICRRCVCALHLSAFRRLRRNRSTMPRVARRHSRYGGAAHAAAGEQGGANER
ncbi:MAG: SPASM domain-containing protein [Acidobacteriota bacterium]